MRCFSPLLFVLAVIGLLFVPQLQIDHTGSHGQSHASNMSHCKSLSSADAKTASACSEGTHGEHHGKAGADFHCPSCFMMFSSSDNIQTAIGHQKFGPVQHPQFVATRLPPLLHPPRA